MQKLLIADCNEDFRLALSEALQPNFHVLSCGNGRMALEILYREKPDLLVLDLMLPELDGLSLLEDMVSRDIHPKVLIITSLITDYTHASTQRLGIQYVMRKPSPIQAAVSRILDLSHSVPQPRISTKDRIKALLLSLGISQKHDGFGYMVDGIEMLLEDPTLAITKILYPGIAKRYRKKPKDIERSIRSALEAGFLRGDPALWNTYFPGAVTRPSNGEFLTKIAEWIRREME